jgi:hypothetical protein
MCKEEKEVQGYFSALYDRLAGALNGNLQEYNKLRPLIEKLAQQNAGYRGPIVEGASSMISNRINGAYALYRSPRAFYDAGLSGFNWAYYFYRSGNLNNDVRDVGMSVVYSHLWPLSFSGIVTAGVTAVNLRRGGAKELAAQAQTRYEQQRNALVASATGSMAITQLFKQVGNVVQTDLQRQMVKGAMRTWQISGIVGIFYGLSLINNTMEETGSFGSELKAKRDKFISSTSVPGRKELEDVAKDQSDKN